MFTFVLLLPLLSSVTILFLGRFIGTYGSMCISVFNVVCAQFTSILVYLITSHSNVVTSSLWTWVNLNEYDVVFGFRYDSLTAVMFLVVTTVSSLVHIYSCVYMYTDPFLSRFMSYLSLFTFFMLVLVSSDSLLVLFLGWEGVGLCSYLLIGFWHTRIQAGKAATKAFLINKVGDLFLLSGLALTFMVFHSLDFSVISILAPFYSSNILEVIGIFLFLGAVGKSAQIGLHTWLPDAMEGPTPVSALIHAATMVTAGVFLIIRVSFLLEFAPKILYMIALWGGITALISGIIGSVQNDIKKIIAYSTCSQLGYMILSCGLSAYNVGFFHLFNHAFFKALLFLSAGSVIHLLNGEQDIRRMGSLSSLNPFIYVNVLIGSLALCGFPFLAGFYSKDVIIEISNTQVWISGQFIYWAATISAMLTMYYSVRLLFFVFINSFNGFKHTIKNYHKPALIEYLVLSILLFLSVLSGFIFKDSFVGLGSNYFNNSIVILPTTWSAIDLEFIPFFIKLLPLNIGVISFLIAIKLNLRQDLNWFINNLNTRFESNKWYYNEFINNYISLPVLKSGRHLFEQYEKYNLEYNGPLLYIQTIYKLLNQRFNKL